jgi:predicted RNase H-like HicB family nuclease
MARKKEKILQFKVLIEQDEDGVYVASVPELPGCYTQAKTLETARKRIKEAIELVLESDKKLANEKSSKKSPPGPRFFGIEDVTVRYA